MKGAKAARGPCPNLQIRAIGAIAGNALKQLAAIAAAK
jgi:hypothetical protein